MKRLRSAGKSNMRGAGWAGKIFQESDSDGEQPRRRTKDLHPHAIVNATPAGAHSSIVNVSTDFAALPKPAPPSFEFTDIPAPHDTQTAHNFDSSEVDMESFFQEYGLMDPELSAAWDEDHGLKAKRARTASVSKSIIFLLELCNTNTIAQDNPMLQWRDHSRELVLDEMLWLEGRGLYADLPCGECFSPRPLYRCKDCFGGQLFCQGCIAATHCRSPFHVIEVSNSLILAPSHS